MKIHASVTFERVRALAEGCGNIGVCITCGEEVSGVEPDARKYLCDGCGQDAAYGVEQIIIEGLFN